MKKTLEQLNSTLFTSNNIPLPVEDDEDILYYNPNTKFVFQTGDGIPATTRKYLSYKGFLYLTNYRLIFRPNQITEKFSSFSVPISKLFFQEQENKIDFIVENNFMASIYLSFEDSDPTVFYKCLKEMLKNVSFKPTFIDEEDENVEEPPLYSELYN
ncbi:Rho GTPAse activating protein [Vairimorpha necatrix]|uniref:Rho GTPAse activating protein n=1 Tax=Vairimorpha necatrix TaxID=6039 RepID=A0AAX4JC69_9MICR